MKKLIKSLAIAASLFFLAPSSGFSADYIMIERPCASGGDYLVCWTECTGCWCNVSAQTTCNSNEE